MKFIFFEKKKLKKNTATKTRSINPLANNFDKIYASNTKFMLS